LMSIAFFSLGLNLANIFTSIVDAMRAGRA
jgi:hypothetical protein